MSKPKPHKGTTVVEPPSRKNGFKSRIFSKIKLLGRGGFAEVWSVAELSTGEKYALKIVDKSQLKEKMRVKLESEIEIQAKMRHINVCKFYSYFQNTTYVFLLLEVCNCQSLSHLLKEKKKLSELEAKYFLYQLLNGVLYLHDSRVIHRDLKIQNLFLDDNLVLKIGDFGLAAMLSVPGERKRTMCGTINYISPEVLTRAPQGHSYEVDIWSIGVILFTLLVGKPPFETMSMKLTCDNIKTGYFSFPFSAGLSEESKNLITWMLQKNPKMRPTPLDALGHEFFANDSDDFVNCPSGLNYYAFGHVKKFPKKMLEKKRNGVDFRGKLKTANVVIVRKMTEKKKVGDVVKFGIGKSKKGVRRPLGELDLPTVYYRNIGDIGDGKKKVNLEMEVIKKTPPQKRTRKNEYMKKVHEKLETSICQIEEKYSYKKKKLSSYNRKENPLLDEIRMVAAAGVKIQPERFYKLRKDEYLPPSVFVKNFNDSTEKYGMAYRYNTGIVGCFFNDRTIMQYNSSTMRIRYFTRSSEGGYMEKRYTIKSFPHTIRKKIVLIKHFYDKFQRNRGVLSPIPGIDDTDVFVKMFVKQGSTYVFRLSNRCVQVRFRDASQVVLSREAKKVTYTCKRGTTRTLMLNEVCESDDPGLAKRLKYTKNILYNLIHSNKIGV